MKEMLHMVYVIILLVLMIYWFVAQNICGVCFIGFLLINARLNELERIKDIVDAIERYTNANMLIPKSWVKELQELLAKYLIYEKIT